MSDTLLGTVFYEILLTIDTFLYKFFSFLYGIYIEVASLQILTKDLYDEITSRIYVVVGVLALFMVAYSLLQHIINPDDKKNGNGFEIVKKVVIAFVLVILIPTLFTFLYNLQTSILTGNVIGNIILGDMNNEIQVNYEYETIVVEENDDGDEIENTSTLVENETYTELELQIVSEKVTGNEIGLLILQGFLYPSDGTAPEYLLPTWEGYAAQGQVKGAVIGCAVGAVASIVIASISAATLTAPATAVILAVCGGVGLAGGVVGGAAAVTYQQLTQENWTWTQVVTNTTYDGDFSNFIPFAGNIGETVDYMPIVSTIAAGFLVYLMFNFILDMGLRVIKLAFYQIIAPIPIFLSILPSNSSLLQNYFKTVMTVYLEVFVRIICLTLMVYFVDIINEISYLESDFMLKAIIVISAIAILRELPKLFGDITGIKGAGLKLGIKDKLAAGGVFTAGAAVGGGITSAVHNATHAYKNKSGFGKGFVSTLGGLGSGTARGVKAGWGAKNFKDMNSAANKATIDAQDARNRRTKRAIKYESNMDDTPFHIASRFGDVKDKVELWAGSIRTEEEIKNDQAAREEVKKYKEREKEIAKDVLMKNKLDINDDTQLFEEAAKASADNLGLQAQGIIDKYNRQTLNAFVDNLNRTGFQDHVTYARLDGTAWTDKTGNVVSVTKENFHEYLAEINSQKGLLDKNVVDEAVKVISNSQSKAINAEKIQLQSLEKDVVASIQTNYGSHGLQFTDIREVGVSLDTNDINKANEVRIAEDDLILSDIARKKRKEQN